MAVGEIGGYTFLFRILIFGIVYEIVVLQVLPVTFTYFVSYYPAVLPEEIPAIFILQKIGSPLLLISFQIVLFGTLIETGTGLFMLLMKEFNPHCVPKEKSFLNGKGPLWLLCSY
jgi:hypothetical protein